jgi:hypothetical protein
MFHSSPAKSNTAQAGRRSMQYLKANKVPMLFQSYREAIARVSADGLDSVTYLSA